MYTASKLYKLILYWIDNYPLNVSQIVYSTDNSPEEAGKRINEQKQGTEKNTMDWWNKTMLGKHCTLKLISSEEYYKLLGNPWEGKEFKNIGQSGWDRKKGDCIFIDTANGNKRVGAIDVKTSYRWDTGSPEKYSVLGEFGLNKTNFYICIGKPEEVPENIICIPAIKLLTDYNNGFIPSALNGKLWLSSLLMGRYNHRNNAHLGTHFSEE